MAGRNFCFRALSRIDIWQGQRLPYFSTLMRISSQAVPQSAKARIDAKAAQGVAMAETADVSIAFVGSGGAGVLTTGAMLLEAACAAGWNGLRTQSVGAQIRGGEALAIVRLAAQ